MPKQQPRVPASPAIVTNIILEILRSETPLKRSEIILKLRQLLPLKGFTYNARQSVFTTKKALSQLLNAGRITTPRIGWYTVPQNSKALLGDSDGQDDSQGAKASPEDSNGQDGPLGTDDSPPSEPDTPKLKIEREIGEGPECVYVYFHDAHFELAQRNGVSTWECKVGWTVGEPDVRIMGQGALTCFPRCPVIGLVIRTHDGRNLERLLHAALSYAGARIKNGAGSEWFLTSPDLVERWFLQFKETVKTLQREVISLPQSKL